MKADIKAGKLVLTPESYTENEPVRRWEDKIAPIFDSVNEDPDDLVIIIEFGTRR